MVADGSQRNAQAHRRSHQSDNRVKSNRGRSRPDFKINRGKRRDEKQCGLADCKRQQPTAPSGVKRNI